MRLSYNFIRVMTIKWEFLNVLTNVAVNTGFRAIPYTLLSTTFKKEKKKFSTEFQTDYEQKTRKKIITFETHEHDSYEILEVC